MREVALNYHSCGASSRLARLVQEIQNQRNALESSHLVNERKCCLLERERQCHNFTYTCSVVALTDYSISSDFNMDMCQPSYPNSIFQGLNCRTNQSVNFKLIDASQYSNFLSSLGFTPKQRERNKDVAFLLDPKVTAKNIRIIEI